MVKKNKSFILRHIRTENIRDTNILLKAVIVCVGKKIGFKAWRSKNMGHGKNKWESERWWKRGIKNKWKHINILERHQRGEIWRK